MAKDPGIGKKMIATVMDVKGDCSAGHAKGDTLRSVVIILRDCVDFSSMTFSPACPPSSLEELSPGGKAIRLN